MITMLFYCLRCDAAGHVNIDKFYKLQGNTSVHITVLNFYSLDIANSSYMSYAKYLNQ